MPAYLLQAITAHVESLRVWTFNQLQQLTHTNGEPLVRVFGHHEEGPEHQGGIFQFQVSPTSMQQKPVARQGGTSLPKSMGRPAARQQFPKLG